MAVAKLKTIQEFLQKYNTLCSSMLILDLLSSIRVQKWERIGYQSHWTRVVLLTMPNLGPWSIQWPTFWLICSLMSPQSNAKPTWFLDGNCFFIASTFSEYSLRQMFLTVLIDGSTSSRQNALHDHHSSRSDIAFHGVWARTNRNMRYRFQVSWWTLAVTKSLGAT